MKLEKLGMQIKNKIESIDGLKIFGDQPLHKPYREEDYLFRIEWTGYTRDQSAENKRDELMQVFIDIGITPEMITHLKLGVSRGCYWYTFFGGIRGKAMDWLLAR